MKKISKWFKHLSRAEQIILGFVVVALIGTASASTGNNPTTSSPQKKPSPTPSKVHTPTVTTKTETETQAIPFTSTTVENSTMAKGTTKITTAGVNGSKTLTYAVTYTDGKQTDKKLVSTVVTLQPVTQVTSVGTYVAPPPPTCPNGTYVNSTGNTVCSPYQSGGGAPAGATAQCGDGSYSFSQSRSGTCSHHGGVATWL